MVVVLSSGSNAHGQLSNGSLEDSHTFVPCSFAGSPPGATPPRTRRIIDIASGANHTLVLLSIANANDEGGLHTELWGCGDGSSGQLGSAYVQDAQTTSLFRPIDPSLQYAGLSHYWYKFISASWETSYIVLSCADKADVLISMGADDFGDLGVGGVKKGKGKPTTAPFHIVNFDHLTIDGVPVKKDSISVESVDAGQHHVVVQLRATLMNEAEVVVRAGWGTSRHGQLGNVTVPGGRAIPFFQKPTVVSVDDPDDRIIAQALGSQHTVFLHASGKVSGLGSNRKGQLRGLEDIKRVVELGCTWNGTYMLVQDEQGKTNLVATGSHMRGQLGRELSPDAPSTVGGPGPSPVEFPANSGRVTRIACGTEHVLALCFPDKTRSDSQKEVWGWGWNEHGNLGTGTMNDVFVPVKVWSDPEGSLVPFGVWAGSGTSWIVCYHRFKDGSE